MLSVKHLLRVVFYENEGHHKMADLAGWYREWAWLAPMAKQRVSYKNLQRWQNFTLQYMAVCSLSLLEIKFWTRLLSAFFYTCI